MNGWGDAPRAGAGEAARGMSLPRVPGRELGDAPRLPASALPVFPKMVRVWSATFFEASFIAFEVTAGGGTPSRATGAGCWYEGGGVPRLAATASWLPGTGIARDPLSVPGAGVAIPW